MNNERILERKFDKLNRLKSMLVSRVDVEESNIIDDIKETVEDLEAILLDFEYIKPKEEVEYRTYRSFRDNMTFCRDELEKYDGKEGMPLYIEVEGNVYDATNTLSDSQDVDVEEISSYYIENRELLNDLIMVGKVLNN